MDALRTLAKMTVSSFIDLVFLSASPKLGYILNFSPWRQTIAFIIVITKTFLCALYPLNLKLSYDYFQQVCILKYTFQIFLR